MPTDPLPVMEDIAEMLYELNTILDKKARATLELLSVIAEMKRERGDNDDSERNENHEPV